MNKFISQHRAQVVPGRADLVMAITQAFGGDRRRKRPSEIKAKMKPESNRPEIGKKVIN